MLKIFSVVRKCNKTSPCIRKLLTEDGQKITNPEHIRKKIKSFYENLYTKKSWKAERECLEYLSGINTPHLSQSDKASCEGKLTLQNIWEALISMKNGKHLVMVIWQRNFMFASLESQECYF